MDQRRLFLFLGICFLLVLAFGPKPRPKKKPAVNEATVAAQGENLAGVIDEEAQADPNNDETNVAGDAAEQLEEVPAELQYVTLGSVDSDSPYRLLVTLTSQGSGVRRIELSSKRFRDLHDRGGYLGHLELASDEQSGLLIRSVGAGTPAAKAGLELGDRIVSVTNGEEQTPLTTPDAFAKLLSKSKPGKQMTLQVARGDEAPVDRVVTLVRRPLEVIRPEAENVLMREDTLPVGVISPPSFQWTFEQLGAAKMPSQEEVKAILFAAEEQGVAPPAIREELAGITLRDSNWEISAQDETSVTFRKSVPKYNLEVLKTYHLEPVPEAQQRDKNYPGYSLTLDLEVRNLSSADLSIRYRLDGPNGLPTEGWWYANKVSRSWSASGIRDLVTRYVDSDVVQFGPTAIAAGTVETMQGRPLAFAGIDAQYFSAILLPKKPTLETPWIDELRAISLSPKPKKRSVEGRYVNATCRLISHPIELAANQSFKHSYEIFAGPKRPDLLAEYHASESEQYGLNDLMYYGWFGWVSKPMLAVLHFFYSLIGNYGIAIVMLTMLVRGCMFPISRKQAQSMAKMQELRPEMDKIKEKYKQDMQKQSQATQELYRKHNINPLAGCLPLFIQMPIFMGLYRALMVDVELRQAPLLGDAIRWCSNLAAPDMLYDWSSFMPDTVTNGVTMLIGLGPYLNVLPLVTAGLFLLQQKLFMPEPANEQAAMQQKIMKYMMLLMGLMFFKVAAGLCLYFIASSIWGIVERKMLPKPPEAGALATVGGSNFPDTPSRSSATDRAPRRNKKSKKKKR